MANEKYLANTLYNVTTGAFYHEVGLPGDEDTGDDVVTGGEVAAAKVVVGDQTAIVHLTDSTGVTPDSTIANVVAASAAAGEATAADLTTTNAALAVLEENDSDLAAKIEAILDALEAAGLLTPPA